MMWEFMKSEWFVPEVDNWHLKEGAPKEIQEEFEEYMKEQQQEREENTIID